MVVASLVIFVAVWVEFLVAAAVFGVGAIVEAGVSAVSCFLRRRASFLAALSSPAIFQGSSSASFELADSGAVSCWGMALSFVESSGDEPVSSLVSVGRVGSSMGLLVRFSAGLAVILVLDGGRSSSSESSMYRRLFRSRLIDLGWRST